MNWHIVFRRFDPAIPRNWLLALAGLMWTGVGLMLCNLAVRWLTHPLSPVTLVLGLLGAAVSVVANWWQFSRLALKNIERILAGPERVCAFAFQAWQGYVIIAVMVSAGVLLRNSAFPKPYLAVVYAAVGGALLQASYNYYARLARVVSGRSEEVPGA